MFDIESHIQKGNRYYIYGTEGTGVYCYTKITQALGAEAVAGFIETKPQRLECCQKKVIAADEIGNLDDSTYIILASANYFKEMYENLTGKGIAAEKIIVLDKLYPYFKTLKSSSVDCIKRACFWPPINNEDKDVIKKISWFLPDRAEVTVWCEGNVLTGLNENVHIAGQENVEDIFEASDVICVWDLEKASDKLEGYQKKLYVVDPDFWHFTGTINYAFLYYESLSRAEREASISQSRERFQKLKTENRKRRANIFCAGPSIEEIYYGEFQEDFNMIANSLVKDKAFLERIRPKLIAFTDVNFYMSPNEHSLKFYEDVLSAVERYEADIITFDYLKPLIVKHFPEIKGRIIGIPPVAKNFVFPDTVDFSTKATGNILTAVTLPAASALCDEIGIAGCTGRSREENGGNSLWKYNPNMQYSELKQSVINMWPSVFRDEQYDDFYDNHCEVVEALLRYGEGCGKKYINMTTSYIPALEKRIIK